MKAVIFARVSSIGQEDGVSLEAQEEKLRAYCQKKDFEILQFFRVVESSTRGNRKQFHQALKLIKQQKHKTAMIVHTTDRLLRGFKDYGLLDELKESGKLEIHVTSEQLILNKDSDWAEALKFDMNVFVGKMVAAQISQHVKKAVQYKIAHGLVIGNVPTGYLNKRNPDTGDACVILDPQRAILIKRLFEEYATGTYSVKELAEKAEDWGLTSPRRGNRVLNRTSIDNILKNPYYMGFARYKGKLTPHVYPILIDETTFERCQQVREGNRVKPLVHTDKPFVFRGLMTCASCGCSICSDLKKGRYTYLFCTKAKGKDKCTSKRIREEKATAMVENVLNRLTIPEPLLEQIRNHLIEINQAGQTDYQETVASLQKERAKQEEIQGRLLDLYLQGSITQPEYDRKHHQIEKHTQRLDRQILSGRNNHKEFQDSLMTLLKVVSKAGQLFKSSKIEQKRKILTFLFSNLWLDGEEVRYELNKPFDKLIDLPNDQKWWVILGSNPCPHTRAGSGL